MKAMFRLFLAVGITITFIGTWACVGQNTGYVGPDADSSGANSEGSVDGAGLAPDGGSPDLLDSLGGEGGNLEGDGSPSNLGENPNVHHSGEISSGNQVMEVQGISTSKLKGVLQAAGMVTQNSYCTEKFEDCDADADNVSEKAACGSNYEKCMEPNNCSVLQQVCLKNNTNINQCTYDYGLCKACSKYSGQYVSDCLANGGDQGLCSGAHKNCNIQYDHCLDLRTECQNNYGGNAQQCQTVYNDCIKNT